jgi:hypothetical protein
MKTLFYGAGRDQRPEGQGNFSLADIVVIAGGQPWVIEIKECRNDNDDADLAAALYSLPKTFII